jgi:hypothetical protein
MDFRQDYRIATFPIERGAFASYNKVKEPFDIRVTFISDGRQQLLVGLLSGGALGALVSGVDPNASNRASFLNNLEVAIRSLALFSVVTPEVTYPSVNIIHYDYHREARNGGATMLRVDVWCQEVRVAAKPAFSNGQMAGTDPITGTATGDSSTGGGNTSAEVGGPGGTATAQPTGAITNDGGTVQPVDAASSGPAGTGGPSTAGQQGGVLGQPTGEQPAINVRTVGTPDSVPPGRMPLYNNGNYVGYVAPNTTLPPGFTVGPLVPGS